MAQLPTVTVSNICIGPATLKVDGVDVGGLNGGVQIAKSVDVYPIEVDSVRAPVRHIPVKEALSLKTTMAEATLKNLQIIWNIPNEKYNDTATTGSLKIGMSTGVVEHTLEITGVAPNGATRVYTVRRAISIKPSEHMYQRTKETLFPVEFDILPDLTQPAGDEFGQIVDYKNVQF